MAPYLVGPDGLFLRDESGKPLICDLAGETTPAYDAFELDRPRSAAEPDTSVDLALAGVFEVDGTA